MAKASKPKQPAVSVNRPSFLGFLQTIILAAINKGQMALIMTTLIIIAIIIKMTPADVKDLAFKIVDTFEHFHMLGWILTVVMLIIWLFSFRMIRHSHMREV